MYTLLANCSKLPCKTRGVVLPMIMIAAHIFAHTFDQFILSFKIHTTPQKLFVTHPG